ncbi:MAG: DsbA family protein [Candidatus Jacksonbacteria bacterium]|nr:DsbA family protein [Candidatus Jacksonbacteria bacterium]MBT6300920.1 DsbA family protein [Candidatus Jacksonbacteria bacterium]
MASWYLKPKIIVLWIAVFVVVVGITWFGVTVFLFSQQIKSGTFDYSALSTDKQSKIAGITDSVSKASRNTQLVVTLDDPSVGPRNSPVTVVEFGDFECPFCQAFYPTMKSLMARYQNRVFFQYRDLPLTSIHDYAQKAAEAAECVHEQGNDFFWRYHDILYENQQDLTDEALKKYARQTGIDMIPFIDCFESGTYTEEVTTDRNDALSFGATGTPTLFINGVRVTGVISESKLIQVIDQLLEQAEDNVY